MRRANSKANTTNTPKDLPPEKPEAAEIKFTCMTIVQIEAAATVAEATAVRSVDVLSPPAGWLIKKQPVNRADFACFYTSLEYQDNELPVINARLSSILETIKLSDEMKSM